MVFILWLYIKVLGASCEIRNSTERLQLLSILMVKNFEKEDWGENKIIVCKIWINYCHYLTVAFCFIQTMFVMHTKVFSEMILKHLISLYVDQRQSFKCVSYSELPLIVYPQWNVTRKWISLSSKQKYKLNLVSISLSSCPFNWHFSPSNKKPLSLQSQL